MRNNEPIRGILTLVPTPFDDRDKLDIVAFKDNIKYLESIGMNGIVVASSIGEFYALTDEEFKEIATAARDECNSMVCVINCSYQNTRTTVDRVKYAEEIGADCAMIYTYHYMQAPTPVLYNEHIKIIYEATKNIRFMLLNDFREAKGVHISNEQYTRLLEQYPRITAIVEDVENASENDIIPLTYTFDNFSDRVSVLSRSEAGLLPGMALGGKGCLATYGLAIPQLLLKLYEYCDNKDFYQALKLYQVLTRYPSMKNVVGVNIPGRPCPLFPGTFTTPIGNTHVILGQKVGTIFPGTATISKAMADAAGRKVGNLRLPLLPPTPAMKAFAREWFEDINR